MNLTVICVVYPPINSSAAIQINHLVEALAMQGHSIEVITPDSSIKDLYICQTKKNIRILRFKNGKVTDVGHFLRAFNEFIMPFKIIYTILKSPIKLQSNDGIICWSPSIFLTPLVIYLKIINKCKCYLILRDIFPKWAKDLKIIRNNIIYNVFYFFFLLQCFFADTIGIQSIGNKKFVPSKILFKKNKIEILNNWYTPNLKTKDCKLNLKETILKDKKVFIYAGNIGLAQGFEILINVAEKLQNNKEIGFLFIGRGSQFEYMRKIVKKKSIINVIFEEQIDNSQLINLYKQCHCGIVILDRRHKTHNIPGKFISYLHSGLPVFALVNSKNDLIPFVNENKLGYATDRFDENEIINLILKLLINKNLNSNIEEKCKEIAKIFFNTEKIAEQILASF